ncbi:MAG: helix-turn-helix domain-containing protein [Patescibacteria group bacterium]|nr:helix-turn-helix domain-containing protein [Patescibacteria group bacterium]
MPAPRTTGVKKVDRQAVALSNTTVKDKTLEEFHKLTEVEQQTITALVVNNNNVREAAKDLGMTREALYFRMRKYPKIGEYITYVQTTKPMLRLLQSADRLAEHMIKLGLRAKSENVQLEATKHALDIVGVSPKKEPPTTQNIQLNNIIGLKSDKPEI